MLKRKSISLWPHGVLSTSTTSGRKGHISVWFGRDHTCSSSLRCRICLRALGNDACGGVSSRQRDKGTILAARSSAPITQPCTSVRSSPLNLDALRVHVGSQSSLHCVLSRSLYGLPLGTGLANDLRSIFVLLYTKGLEYTTAIFEAVCLSTAVSTLGKTVPIDFYCGHGAINGQVRHRYNWSRPRRTVAFDMSSTMGLQN